MIVALALLVGIIAAGGALVAFDRSYAGRIYPNVSVRGVPIGELTPQLARATLEQQFAPFLAQPVILTYGDQMWAPTLAELGVRLEIDRAVEQAYLAGRGHDPLTNLAEMFAVYRNGLELPLHLTVDQATMQAYLLSLAERVERPALDARIALNGALIAVTPAASGQQVLVDETLRELTTALQSLAPQTIALRTRTVAPRLSDAAVQAAREEIARLLAGPLTISVEGARSPVVWSLEDLARLVRVERQEGPGGATLAVTVDRARLRAKLEDLAATTAIPGRLPRVDWNGGNLRIFKEGVPGRRLDVARAEELVLAAFDAPADARQVSLALTEESLPVTAANLDQLGITELLGVGRSDFSGSAAYRVTNIQAGMRLLHGVLIPPGAEFSFNETIGRIDASNGFVEGYAIVQNRTQLEWGGGICQDSTTMFRAAFWAGLPITERWGHSFYISWYDKYGFGDYGNGPGMDATIFSGALDLKFLNDTGNWLLIQALADPSQALAEVRIYGTSDGRKVSLIGPTITERIPAPTRPRYVADPRRPRGSIRQTDRARGGMTIQFTRVIERDGQIIERRLFETKFKPWPNIYEVNPADLGPDGRPIPYQPAPTPDPNAAPTTDPAAPPPADGQAPGAPDSGQLVPVQPPQPEPLPPPVEGDPSANG
ncbi:MAG: VanW family protein [Oscillochloridaceae bacterium]|nr:VanW family protein [Chloroflexaceae bacterium]MDW8389741.1 VanW family protein [Oscillochloridaceae bacterium]